MSFRNTDHTFASSLKSEKSKKYAEYGLLAGMALGTAAFFGSRYVVCKPSQQLVKTGLGIADMTVSKKSIIWPFQKYQIVDLNPRSYSFLLHHMSKENVEFHLPISFTVKHYNPDTHLDLFKNYCRTMTSMHDSDIETTIKSIANGEMRILSARRTIEEMFSDKEVLKSCVTDIIQKDLDQFGQQICNANIEEMSDLPRNQYFEFRKKRAIESANNEARVNVAEAKKIGDVGERTKQALAIQEIAQLNSTTIRIENERQLEIELSRKNLEVKKADYKKEVEIARLQSNKARDIREAELQKEVESKRIEQKKEALRATDLSKATVVAESLIEEAKGKAEATRQLADADLYSKEKEATARLALSVAEAKGLDCQYKAQADGLQSMLVACGGNADLLKFYIASNTKLFQQLAESNAKAVNNMNPKIQIWAVDGDKGNALGPITNIMKSLPPMMSVLEQQLGFKLPDSLLTSDKQQDIKTQSV